MSIRRLLVRNEPQHSSSQTAQCILNHHRKDRAFGLRGAMGMLGFVPHRQPTIAVYSDKERTPNIHGDLHHPLPWLRTTVRFQ